MWNVDFVKENLNPNTLTKSYARILVSVNVGQYQLENIRILTRDGNRYNDGIEILLDNYLRTDIGQSLNQNTYKSYEQLDIIKNILSKKRKTKQLIGSGVEDTTQDMLIGKQSAN